MHTVVVLAVVGPRRESGAAVCAYALWLPRASVVAPKRYVRRSTREERKAPRLPAALHMVLSGVATMAQLRAAAASSTAQALDSM